ncbi:TylF/MycF/NovP-related O-methyltransferase [Algihabitans albus]|uniref:TylF/MycF/NovP-related O-methyltransferase n=1 Tax=Algihabitans albus TaxID=2164067 RepID=UPI0013C327EC|nr:TylF/MycF/NovP-related O-methyltransferase [Algihabitans albus]
MTHRLDPIARRVQQQRLTYLATSKLYSLTRQIDRLNREGVAGDLYEFGIALGGSSIIMASKMQNRHYHGFDVFGTIPPPSEQDERDSHERYAVIEAGRSKGIEGDDYYGYVDDLYDRVVRNFADCGLAVDGERIALHKGLFEDTLTLAPGTRIALAHVDCDWYEPVKFCLEQIADHMSLEGAIIIDDFNDYQGCRKATCDFLASDSRFLLQTERPHAILIRRAEREG